MTDARIVNQEGPKSSEQVSLQFVSPEDLARLSIRTYQDLILQNLAGAKILLEAGGGFRSIGGQLQKAVSGIRRFDIILGKDLAKEALPVRVRLDENNNYIELSQIEDEELEQSIEPPLGQTVSEREVKDKKELIQLIRATNRRIILNQVETLNEDTPDLVDQIKEIMDDIGRLCGATKMALENQVIPIRGNTIDIRQIPSQDII